MQHAGLWVYQALTSDLKFERQFEFLCFGYLCPLILTFGMVQKRPILVNS